jgi:hypothetical protein
LLICKSHNPSTSWEVTFATKFNAQMAAPI